MKCSVWGLGRVILYLIESFEPASSSTGEKSLKYEFYTGKLSKITTLRDKSLSNLRYDCSDEMTKLLTHLHCKRAIFFWPILASARFTADSAREKDLSSSSGGHHLLSATISSLEEALY